LRRDGMGNTGDRQGSECKRRNGRPHIHSSISTSGQ
jgi:hypothetical protein